jgi:hypothetical protein
MQNNFAVWCRTILLASSTPSSKEALARRLPRSYSPACIEHAPAADGCHAMSSRKHYHRAGDTACASEGMNAEQALTRNAQERRASARRGSGITPATPSVSYRMRMLACHGGLTPPALGGSAVRTLPAKLRPVRYTNAHLQERRASPRCACSTVYAIESPNHRQSRTHATPKSGGRQPAVVRYHPRNRKCFSQADSLPAPQLAYASRC